MLPDLETLAPQTGKKKRPFINIGVERIKTLPPKWVGKELKSCWRHDFKYLDKEGGYFSIELDYNNKLLNR
jgi:hypothetical protein